ncbi:MAG: nucleotidyltransferase domain-containing protein [Vicinamibacterales bacterium]
MANEEAAWDLLRDDSRWRLQMAERLGSHLDGARFGVRALYVIGSTKDATAGPGSDIDLLVLFEGTPAQREALMLWLEGWSLCLGETNRLRTGHDAGGMLDVHIVTAEDVADRTSYAVKIGSARDPARRIPIHITPGRA